MGTRPEQNPKLARMTPLYGIRRASVRFLLSNIHNKLGAQWRTGHAGNRHPPVTRGTCVQFAASGPSILHASLPTCYCAWPLLRPATAAAPLPSDLPPHLADAVRHLLPSPLLLPRPPLPTHTRPPGWCCPPPPAAPPAHAAAPRQAPTPPPPAPAQRGIRDSSTGTTRTVGDRARPRQVTYCTAAPA